MQLPPGKEVNLKGKDVTGLRKTLTSLNSGAGDWDLTPHTSYYQIPHPLTN